MRGGLAGGGRGGAVRQADSAASTCAVPRVLDPKPHQLARDAQRLAARARRSFVHEADRADWAKEALAAPRSGGSLAAGSIVTVVVGNTVVLGVRGLRDGAPSFTGKVARRECDVTLSAISTFDWYNNSVCHVCDGGEAGTSA